MGIASMALPGSVRTFGVGGTRITPDDLFKGPEERDAYRKIIGAGQAGNIAPDVKVKRVCVRIFDLSDKNQAEEYEKLWMELLEKTAKNEVIVDSRKDLVNRKDGTSYWMKYVEYVEFGDASDSEKTKGDSK